MQHAFDANVLHPRFSAEYLTFDIEAWRRGADNFVLLGSFGFGGRGERQRIAILLVPADLRMELTTADQVGIEILRAGLPA